MTTNGTTGISTVKLYELRKTTNSTNDWHIYGAYDKTPNAAIVKVDILLKLTLKTPNKNCSRRHFIFLLYLSEEISLDVSCESSA